MARTACTQLSYGRVLEMNVGDERMSCSGRLRRWGRPAVLTSGFRGGCDRYAAPLLSRVRLRYEQSAVQQTYVVENLVYGREAPLSTATLILNLTYMTIGQSIRLRWLPWAIKQKVVKRRYRIASDKQHICGTRVSWTSHRGQQV